MMTVRLKLTWIDSRITLPAAQNQPQTKKSSHPVKPLPLDIFHRNLIWMPNFVTTFRTKILSDFFRTESDFVTLLATPSNQTKVQVQVVVKLNEPCPNMNFKVWFIKCQFHRGLAQMKFFAPKFTTKNWFNLQFLICSVYLIFRRAQKAYASSFIRFLLFRVLQI
jgi:hypothetical protein